MHISYTKMTDAHRYRVIRSEVERSLPRALVDILLDYALEPVVVDTRAAYIKARMVWAFYRAEPYIPTYCDVRFRTHHVNAYIDGLFTTENAIKRVIRVAPKVSDHLLTFDPRILAKDNCLDSLAFWLDRPATHTFT